MSTSDPDAPEIPESFRTGAVVAGKYVVERVLGVGGMGVVVAANHSQLDQRVALKMMHADLLHHRPLVDRFVQEARSAVRLRSEHVSRILDVGRLENGAPYIVMEYLDGRSLAEELHDKGRFSMHRAVHYVLQACEAVAEAHALGMVHRDLKPDNLFLTSRVHGAALVKVLDFGIAKAANLGPSKTGASNTHATAMLGTPEYMAPEQMRSAKDVDARADIWSLGVVLYEFLTGRRPFEGESPAEISAKVLRDDPTPLDTYRLDVPVRLAAAISRCLKKDPALRFGSVAALADALAQFAPSGDEASRRIAAVQGPRTPVPLESELPPPPEVDLEDDHSERIKVQNKHDKNAATLPPPAPAQTLAATSIHPPAIAPQIKNRKMATLLAAGVAVLGLGAGAIWLATRDATRVNEAPKSAAHEATTKLAAQPSQTAQPAPTPQPANTTPAPESAESTPSASASFAANVPATAPPTKSSGAFVWPIAAPAKSIKGAPAASSAKPTASVAPPPSVTAPPKPPSDDDVLGGRK